MRGFESLSEQEILALAISLEEEDESVYADFAEGLRQDFPATAAVFDGMRARRIRPSPPPDRAFQQEFGDHIPLIRRQDVRGFVNRKPVWMTRPLRLETVRNQVSAMEAETRRFTKSAAARTQDATSASCSTTWPRKSAHHEEPRRGTGGRQTRRRRPHAGRRGQPPPVRAADRAAGAGRPDGWLGLHAGAGFRRGLRHAQAWDAFLVGMAASLGAGISMGFAEALSDDGSLTGRGHPWVRGLICGPMTALGGIGHTLPFLRPRFPHRHDRGYRCCGRGTRRDFVGSQEIYGDVVDLGGLQVGLGGILVFATGVLIGSS